MADRVYKIEKAFVFDGEDVKLSTNPEDYVVTEELAAEFAALDAEEEEFLREEAELESELYGGDIDDDDEGSYSVI